MKRSILLTLTLLLGHAHALAQSVTQQRQRPGSIFNPRQQPPQQPARRPPATRPQQQPAAAPSSQEDAADDVVRITSNLVQFDAVVVDKQGRQVTDLAPDEFELTLGGEPQQITNFSYVSATTAAAAAAKPAPRRAADRTAPPLPPARLSAGEVRRTVALVVDDLNSSFESLVEVRRALRKFVDEQMQPRDLVAIIRTSAGMGALQQFTTDKRLLHKAIERVRWYPRGSVGVGAFTPIQIDPQALLERQSPFAVDRHTGQPLPGGPARREDPNRSAEVEDFRNEKTFSVGTLGALNFIVRGMEQLPGRKSVLMFSEGFELVKYDGRLPYADNTVLDEMRRLTALANHASVVIYTIDARGLPVLGLTAEDNTASLSTKEVSGMLRARKNFHASTQVPLNFLAHETGGFAVRDRNDLAGGVERVLEDQSGYYLIGFRPPEKTFERDGGRPRFHEVSVRVKRDGLRVRTRAGFFGVTDAESSRPVARTRIEQLFGALSSPVASGDMNLRLTSLFSADPQKGSFVSSLMHIDMSRFKFEQEADGWHKAVIDLVALTVGDGGQVVDQVNRTETVRVRGETMRRVVEDGLVYIMAVPVKKPGAYQLRVAVRDAATERLGSASQFIEVPDLKKNRLALSGLVMEGSGYAAATANASVTAAGAAGGGRIDTADPMSSAAVRRFRTGALVDYHLNVYNAKSAQAAGRPQLRSQMRLFRDGQMVFAGQVTPLDPERRQPQETGAARVQVSSRFRLGTDLPPGEYVLQVVVTDALADEKHATAAVWTDFEIVK